MSVSANVRAEITANETLDTNVDAAGTPVITHSAFNQRFNLDATTTPPVTKVYADEVALVAGAATLDLTALAGTGGGTIDGTGLKVQALLFVNTGANVMTLAPGATNGYELFGTAKDVDIPAGGCLLATFDDTLADVSASLAELDIGGTGTQSFQIQLLLG